VACKKKLKKKKPRQCHNIDSVESHDIGGNHEESLFYKDRISKKKFTGAKPKGSYITGVKSH